MEIIPLSLSSSDPLFDIQRRKKDIAVQPTFSFLLLRD
jgi:hypothetical protein